MTAALVVIIVVLSAATALAYLGVWCERGEVRDAHLARDIAERQVLDLQADLAAEATIARTLRAELDGRPVSNASPHMRTIPNLEYLRLVRKADVYDTWAATVPGDTDHLDHRPILPRQSRLRPPRPPDHHPGAELMRAGQQALSDVLRRLAGDLDGDTGGFDFAITERIALHGAADAIDRVLTNRPEVVIVAGDGTDWIDQMVGDITTDLDELSDRFDTIHSQAADLRSELRARAHKTDTAKQATNPT